MQLIKKSVWFVVSRRLVGVGAVALGLFSAVTTPARAAQPLLLSGVDQAWVTNRRQQLEPVDAAMLDMKSDAGREWFLSLTEASFYQRVTGDTAMRQKAIELFAQRTAGSNKFSVNEFEGSPNKYLYSQQCAALALSFGWLYPHLSSAQQEAGRTTLIEWGQRLYAYYSGAQQMAEHNFHTGSVGCLGLIGLTLSDEYSGASAWYQTANQALTQYYYDFSFNPKGDYWEGYHYYHYGAGPAILFTAAYKERTGTDQLPGTGLSKLWTFYTLAFTANGNFPAYGDNTGGAIINGEDLYLLRYLPADQRAAGLWVWRQIRGARADQRDYSANFKDFDRLSIVLFYPDNLSPQMPAVGSSFNTLSVLESKSSGTDQGSTSRPGGMAVLRTGWDPGTNISLWLINRWRWQSHQYYDPNHFALAAYGQTLFGSDNRWSYTDPLRGKLSQHNTILIDKNLWYGDAPTSDFYTGAAASLGSFPDTAVHASADVITSEARYPMVNFSTQQVPAGGYRFVTQSVIQPINTAKRSVALLKDFAGLPFVVIYDRYQRDDQATHSYTWQAYIPGEANNLGGQGTAASPYTFNVGPVTLKSIFLSSKPLELNLLPRLSGRGDQALQATQFSLSLGEFVSILLPTKTGQNFTVNQVSDQPPTLEITANGQTALVIFADDASQIVKDTISSNARVLILRRSGSTYDRFVMLEGTNLLSGSRLVVDQSARTPRVGSMTGDDGPTPTPACGAIPDQNVDGRINLYDYSVVRALLGTNTTSADLNCDGSINFVDLELLVDRFLP